MSGTDLNLGEPGKSELTLELVPEWKYIRTLREYTVGMATAVGFDRTIAEQAGMCLSEVMENAVKYAVPGTKISLNIRYIPEQKQLRVRIENEATPEQVKNLGQMIDQINGLPPIQSYILMLRESATHDGLASQVGLARIRAEGDAWLLNESEGTRTRITVGLPERRTEPPKPGDLERFAKRRADTSKKRKAHFFVTLTHWANVVLLGFALFTGLRLGWGYSDSPVNGEHVGWWYALDHVAPQGEVLGTHVLVSWLLAAVLVVYGFYLFKTKESRRVALQKADLESLKVAFKNRRFLKDKRAVWGANVLVYWLFFGLIFILVLTGFALYKPGWKLDALMGGYRPTRAIHAIATYALIPLMVLHGWLEWVFGIFWAIFKAAFDRKRMLAGVVGTAVGVVSIGALWLWERPPMTLGVEAISAGEAPVLDGDGGDPAWAKAKELVVSTVKGVNAPDGRVDISIRAVHDGTSIYFLYRWADANITGIRYPLAKTPSGWQVLGDGFNANDERRYYEDKLAIYLTDRPVSCSDSCHLGSNPAHAPRPATWGLHYTRHGETADIWQWKYVRTNNMYGVDEVGHSDDQYIGPPKEPPKEPWARYSGGYFEDPKTGGGYKYNFDRGKHDKVGPIKGQIVTPLRLPQQMAHQADGVDPMGHHPSTWWLRETESAPYGPEGDTLPVGTLIPNIIISPFQGDRADVRAKGRWKDGFWTVEFRRVLATGSKFDVGFQLDRPTYLSVAAYLGVQTRHSEHLKAIRVELRPPGPAASAQRP